MRILVSLTFLLLLACVPLSAQQPPTFHDDLLDHLVGKWDVTGTVHGKPSKQILQAEWVLNHQFLCVTEKSVETVAGGTYPFEAVYYVGYDTTTKQYVIHLMTVWGADGDTLGVGQRTGDELKIDFPYTAGAVINRFIWKPESKRWRIVVQDASSDKAPYVELEATRSSPGVSAH